MDPLPKNFSIKNKNGLGRGRIFLVEPRTSWLIQELPGWTRNFRPEVPGRTKKSANGYLTGYQEDEKSQNQVPNREAFFLVGSWLRPEDFGFGHPLNNVFPNREYFTGNLYPSHTVCFIISHNVRVVGPIKYLVIFLDQSQTWLFCTLSSHFVQCRQQAAYKDRNEDCQSVLFWLSQKPHACYRHVRRFRKIIEEGIRYP